MPSSASARWAWFLGASAAIHIVVVQLGVAAVRPSTPSRSVATWTGDTVEVQTFIDPAAPASLRAALSPAGATAPAPPAQTKGVEEPAPRERSHVAQPKTSSRRHEQVARDERAVSERAASRTRASPRTETSATRLEQDDGEGDAKNAATASATHHGQRGALEARDELEGGQERAAAPGGAPAFGGAGPPRGVRDLAAALTRNLPLAVQREPGWDELALEVEEVANVVVMLDPEGRVRGWELEPRAAPGDHPKRMRELARRAVALLGRGQYMLPTGFGSGALRIEISVRAEQGSAHGDDLAEPDDLHAQGWEPPRGALPGTAYFKRNSGRVLRMELRLPSAGPG